VSDLYGAKVSEENQGTTNAFLRHLWNE